MRHASIDIGTNSVLLLVVEEQRDGTLVTVRDVATITRLGRGVDAAHRLSDEALGRTLACLESYAAQRVELGVRSLAAVATSAARDAANGADFLTRAAAVLGVRPQILSGDEEAELTFEGALSGLTCSPRLAVFDIGGGSTEIVVGDVPEEPRGAAARIVSAVSLDVGAVRLTERHLRRDPPDASELECVREDVRRALAGAPPFAGVPLVGVAGTMTTLAARHAGIVPYDGARVHGLRLSCAELSRMTTELAGMPLAQRQSLPGVEPARADVIVAGAVIAEELCAHAGATEVVVSDRGVRWGLVQRLAKQRLDG